MGLVDDGDRERFAARCPPRLEITVAAGLPFARVEPRLDGIDHHRRECDFLFGPVFAHATGDQAIVDEIRDALLGEFKKSLRERYERFLAAAKHTGLPVPVLSVCGQGTQEVRYTKLLGYYMNPSGRHGLGSRVLKSIVKTALARGDHPVEVSASDPRWDEAKRGLRRDPSTDHSS